MAFDRRREFNFPLIMKGRPGPSSWRGKITFRHSKKHPNTVEAVCGRSVASVAGPASREMAELMDRGYIPVIKEVKLGMEPKRTYEGPHGEWLVDEDWTKMSRTVQLKVRMMTQLEIEEERASFEHECARRLAEREMQAERSQIRYSEATGEEYYRAVDGIASAYGLDESSSRILARLGRGESRDEIASDLGVKRSIVDGRISKLYRTLGVHSKEEVCIMLRQQLKIDRKRNEQHIEGQQGSLF